MTQMQRWCVDISNISDPCIECVCRVFGRVFEVEKKNSWLKGETNGLMWSQRTSSVVHVLTASTDPNGLPSGLFTKQTGRNAKKAIGLTDSRQLLPEYLYIENQTVWIKKQQCSKNLSSCHMLLLLSVGHSHSLLHQFAPSLQRLYPTPLHCAKCI